MFKSVGTMALGSEGNVVLLVDQGIADFYRSLVPRSIILNPPKFAAHVSVIRHEQFDLAKWHHEGEQVEFEYDNMVEHDDLYYWLPVQCKRIEEIRIEMGLPRFAPWRNGFHITIGNVKELQHG